MVYFTPFLFIMPYETEVCSNTTAVDAPVRQGGTRLGEPRTRPLRIEQNITPPAAYSDTYHRSVAALRADTTTAAAACEHYLLRYRYVRKILRFMSNPSVSFVNNSTLFSGARGSFLALSAAGHAGGGGVCTLRRRCGSRLGSVVRALGVQSCDIWQVIAGLLSDQLFIERTQTQKKMSFCFRFFSPLSGVACCF